MTNSQAIDLALKAIGKWMQQLAPEANIAVSMQGRAGPTHERILAQYRDLQAASNKLEEMKTEQGRLGI